MLIQVLEVPLLISIKTVQYQDSTVSDNKEPKKNASESETSHSKNVICILRLKEIPIDG